MIRSPGNYNNIHTKPVTAHNQTLSPSDALLLTGGARVGLGAQVQKTNSNNTMLKLLIQKWAQEAAVELCLTASNLSRQAQWHSSTATLTHLTYEILTAPWGPTLWKGGEMGTTQLVLYRKQTGAFLRWGRRAVKWLNCSVEVCADLQSFQCVTAVAMQLFKWELEHNYSLKTFSLWKLCLASVLILCPF